MSHQCCESEGGEVSAWSQFPCGWCNATVGPKKPSPDTASPSPGARWLQRKGLFEPWKPPMSPLLGALAGLPLSTPASWAFFQIRRPGQAWLQSCKPDKPTKLTSAWGWVGLVWEPGLLTSHTLHKPGKERGKRRERREMKEEKCRSGQGVSLLEV